MGHSNLRLVKPCDHLSEKAKALAHGSHEILENAEVFNSLETAIQDLDFTIATTIRHRRNAETYHDIHALNNLLNAKQPAIQKLGVVFGTEASGLKNKDLDRCDILSTIPTQTTFPSLNLSQAVMVFAFVLSNNTKLQTLDQRVDRLTASPLEYKSLKEGLINLIRELEIPDSKKIERHLIRGIARLGYGDLYLLHALRKKISDKIKSLKDSIN